MRWRLFTDMSKAPENLKIPDAEAAKCAAICRVNKGGFAVQPVFMAVRTTHGLYRLFVANIGEFLTIQIWPFAVVRTKIQRAASGQLVADQERVI